ncbi:MAG: hypothetical protein JO252_15815 [Planctomycetaceae bacterium]|nr:hypothetical protein [Planctomycetaceae bacterium]
MPQRRSRPGRGVESQDRNGGVSPSHGRGDEIAAALDRLHAGGWSVGETAFSVEGGGLVHVVIGTNDESRIRPLA